MAYDVRPTESELSEARALVTVALDGARSPVYVAADRIEVVALEQVAR